MLRSCIGEGWAGDMGSNPVADIAIGTLALVSVDTQRKTIQGCPIMVQHGLQSVNVSSKLDRTPAVFIVAPWRSGPTQRVLIPSFLGSNPSGASKYQRSQ